MQIGQWFKGMGQGSSVANLSPRLWMFAICLLWSGSLSNAYGQTRRALLIGINHYQGAQESVPNAAAAKASDSDPGRLEYSDLEGCVNDAEAIREALSIRFDFKSDFIHLLEDAAATRQAILSGIQRYLIDEAQPGDVCFFFYAGHGSRVRNRLSNKPSGMDSTLVPTDAGAEVPDIRDKELARLFNRALDKGVILTAVFDSCHSGSIVRGLPTLEKTRHLPPDPREVADPPDPGPTPEERGALILSAAQDYQSASEARDENGDPHGAFTIALLKALRSVPLNAPVQDLFLSAQVILQVNKPQQVPVLAGVPERRQRPLIGLGTPGRSEGILIAVATVDAAAGEVLLRGGRAMGLNSGCELHRLPRSGENGDTAATLRLKVTSVHGLARSSAKVLSGDPSTIMSGDFFIVDRWVYPSEATLRVWLPSTELSGADLKRLEPELNALRNSAQISWVDDPTEEQLTHILSWDGSGWNLSANGDVGRQLSAQSVLDKVASKSGVKPKLFVNLPLARELADELKLGTGTRNDAIEVTRSPTEADYLLAGHWHDGKIEYCWLRPNSTSAEQSMNPLPLRTDWAVLAPSSNTEAARQLETNALGLGRLRAWLTLEASGSSGYFPYHMALKNTKTGKKKSFGDTLSEDEDYGVVLLAEPNSNLRVDQVQKRWVYVLSIDRDGTTKLLFPRDTQGQVQNRVPYETADPDRMTYPAEIILGDLQDPGLFTVTAPFGVDTYILLTTREELPEPWRLEKKGVRSRGPARPNQLEAFFVETGASSKGPDASVPAEWSIQKLMVRSVPKPSPALKPTYHEP